MRRQPNWRGGAAVRRILECVEGQAPAGPPNRPSDQNLLEQALGADHEDVVPTRTETSQSRGTPLLAWYDSNKRDLPWRRTRDPYAIWVSEVMLQQTQVQTVIPFFERWILRFPTITALAAADEQQVLALWQGLGYYKRCRQLLSGARALTASSIPNSAKQWLKVPGVGRYTAAAIASIAFDEPVALVDGNVERVFARLTGCELESAALRRAAWNWAEEFLNHERPGDHNQALMELGARVCRPAAPLCGSCPLSEACVARATGRQAEIPAPRARPQTIQVDQSAWIPVWQGLFGVRQVPDGEWWHGMWEFPRGSNCPFDTATLRIGSVRHTVTHHRIRLDVHLCRLPAKAGGLKWLSPQALEELPMPSAQRQALKLALKHLASA